MSIQLLSRIRTALLVTLSVVAAGALFGGQAVSAANSVLDSRADSVFYATDARLLAKFPPLESLVPMPRNINPFNRKRVQQRCVLGVVKKNAPVKSARGTFNAQLVVMDASGKGFTSMELAERRFRTDASGQAVFELDIPTELFAEGFRTGDVRAFSHTQIEFTRRKATYAFLRCDITARK